MAWGWDASGQLGQGGGTCGCRTDSGVPVNVVSPPEGFSGLEPDERTGLARSSPRRSTTPYAYDRAGRVDTVTTTTGTRSVAVDYQVDATGNLVARGKDFFRYDQANRLTKSAVRQPTTYAYNGDGLRTRTNAGQGPLQTHVYDVAAGLPVRQILDNREPPLGPERSRLLNVK